MLGSAEEARFIRDWRVERKGLPWAERSEDAPGGWVLLGSGCYRTAYLSPTKVVYKVQHDEQSNQSNKDEAETFRFYHLKKMPAGCRLPRWSLYDMEGRGGAVLAMERFTKLLRDFPRRSERGEKYWNARKELMDVIDDCWDWHDANLAVDVENELLVPIDLGGRSVPRW